MSDLVERLRDGCIWIGPEPQGPQEIGENETDALMREAADEIERLTAALATSRALADELRKALATARNEALEEAKNIANRQALIFQRRGDEEDQGDCRMAAEALRSATRSIDKLKVKP